LATNRLRLSLEQIDTPPGSRCPGRVGVVDRRLAVGDRLSIGNGAVSVRLLGRAGPRGSPVPYGNVLLGRGPTDHELIVVAGPLPVGVEPLPGRPAYLC